MLQTIHKYTSIYQRHSSSGQTSACRGSSRTLKWGLAPRARCFRNVVWAKILQPFRFPLILDKNLTSFDIIFSRVSAVIVPYMEITTFRELIHIHSSGGHGVKNISTLLDLFLSTSFMPWHLSSSVANYENASHIGLKPSSVIKRAKPRNIAHIYSYSDCEPAAEAAMGHREGRNPHSACQQNRSQ
jgi:hypothetical protein